MTAGVSLVSDTAMIMAAGYGKRMRPLTATRPKPLVSVAGKPLIDHVFAKLWDAGITRTVVNVHYLADTLEAHLDAMSLPMDIKISDERDLLLETGGGMVKALPLIERDPFFCINSDNIWLDGPRDVFAELSNFWDADRMDALLLVVPHKRASQHKGMGDFHMDGHGRLSWRKPRRIAPYIYTGIQIVSHRLLRDAPEGPFSTRILWERAVEEGRLFGAIHEGLWCDVGTPGSIVPTENLLQYG
ncbi:MAG: nucleotidyltransferase family protein [Pseudomonadota bacterium]